MEEESSIPVLQVWLKIVLTICFFIAAMSVLDSFINMFEYWTFLSGKMDAELYQEWYGAFKEIHEDPWIFIVFNLYNFLLWNGVIIGSIWLIRYHAWSRKLLVALLGMDMIITVMLLLKQVWTGSINIVSPGWFLFLNSLQVISIMYLSHPRVIQITELLSMRQKQSIQSIKKHDAR